MPSKYVKKNNDPDPSFRSPKNILERAAKLITQERFSYQKPLPQLPNHQDLVR